MRTFPALSPAWVSSGWVLSLSQLLTTVQAEKRAFGVIVHSTPACCDRTALSQSACLSGNVAEQFISILRLPFLGTLEVVSISQPCATLRPLNASITSAGDNGLLESWTNSNGGRAFILSLQINAFASGGVTFASLTKSGNQPDLVVVKHCPFSRTLLLSPDTLAPTSRLLLALASLATKECALFVIGCLKELQRAVGPGRTGTDGCSARELNSWRAFMALTPWSLTGFTLPGGNGAGVGLSEPSALPTTRPFYFARKSPSGPTCPHEWDFSANSCTPFKRTTSST